MQRKIKSSIGKPQAKAAQRLMKDRLKYTGNTEDQLENDVDVVLRENAR